jgi:hypothetical protein
MPISDIANAIAAIGGLGTAAFGLVDASKAAGGGISRIGMGDLKKALKPLFGPNPSATDRTTPLTYASILDTLRANWINGTLLSDQKAIAKSLIKLRLNAATAPVLANATGVDAAELTAIATQINAGQALTQPQADAFGRFDLALTSLFDQAYQRADQRYRNSAKLAASIVSIVIAYVAYLYAGTDHLFQNYSAVAPLIVGLLATPIAPVAKDLASAIAAGTDVAQKLPKLP